MFKVDPAGGETVLHSLSGLDGVIPEAGLIYDAAGSLYGTTSGGGASGAGTVFKLDRKGKEFSVLYSFMGGADGASPNGGLIRDNAGNFYGTTSGGGHLNNGTVFKLDGIGKETVLYRFRGGADGSVPSGGVIRDKAGNFYGTTLAEAISAEQCSSWMGSARRPSCIASEGERTGRVPTVA